jgi:hypothetical protein
VTYGLTKESQLAIDNPESVSKMMAIIENDEFSMQVERARRN